MFRLDQRGRAGRRVWLCHSIQAPDELLKVGLFRTRQSDHCCVSYHLLSLQRVDGALQYVQQPGRKPERINMIEPGETGQV